jgi:Domain of unknown function (DUF222)
MSDPLASIKCMFDTQQSASIPAGTVAPEPSAVPLERVEAQICELAGHLAAATCRFLTLLGDFDARRSWASWGMTSCAAWLSWKCQISSGTAREHVRVARGAANLPVIRAEFGAGRLSYVKVRALTRIARPENEAGLAEIAGPMTGNQLERFARAHRRCSDVDDAAAQVRRRLTWRFEEDGPLAGTFRLPPLAGAAETPRADPPVPGDPADPARCHGEDGPAISISNAPDAGLHRRRELDAARSRRHGPRCRPTPPPPERGYPPRRPGTRHVPLPVPGMRIPPCRPAPYQYWSHAGRTKLTNLISLCRYHHTLVHQRGYLIAARPGPGGAFAFYRPDGNAIPASPALPAADGTIDGCHEADIAADTIIPPWYGERLDLDHAIYVCLANARNQVGQHDPPAWADQPDREDEPEPFRPRKWYRSCTNGWPGCVLNMPSPEPGVRGQSGSAGAPGLRHRPCSATVKDTG